MPTLITDFFNVAAQKQFSRDFLARIKQINLPGLSFDGEDELVYARSASFPGRNIENKVVNYSGQQFNLAGRSVYPNSEGWSVEFYHDQNFELRKKLENASRVAFDNESTTGQLCMPGPESYIIMDVLAIPCAQGNPSDLTAGGELQVIDSLKFVGAGIRDIGDIQYQIAEGTGEILTLTCTFSYHFYTGLI